MATNLEDTLANGEYWAVFVRGGIALRFGPFTAKQFGEVVADCAGEGIVCSMVVNCGQVMDWETIRQLMATDDLITEEPL